MGVRVEQFNAAAGDAFQADLVTVVRAGPVMGPTSPGAVWTRLTANAKRASAAWLTQPADIARLRAYLDGKGATSGSARVRGVIYADTSGAPGMLVAQTAEATVRAGRSAAWINLRIAAPIRLTPGMYWLGLHSTGSGIVARYAATTASAALRVNSDAYSDGAAGLFGPSSTDSKRMAMHAIGG